MKRAAAWAIVGAAGVLTSTMIGNAIRGPWANGGLLADFTAGAAVFGGAAALQWAMRELELEGQAGADTRSHDDDRG